MPSGQALLRPLSRAVGPIAVDLLRALRALGQDDDAVATHLGKASRDGEVVLVTPPPIGHLAAPEGRQERGMTRQHAKVAFGARGYHLVDFSGNEEPGRRRQLELHG